MMKNDCWNKEIREQVILSIQDNLWRNVSPNSSEQKIDESLLKLNIVSKRDLKHLLNIKLLMSKEVENLINEISPKIINRISKQVRVKKSINYNAIKGRVDWFSTYKTRLMSGMNPTLFVTSNHSKVYDLPENKLFVYILNQLLRRANEIIEVNDVDNSVFTDTNNKKWEAKIALVSYQIKSIVKNPLIKHIQVLNNIPDPLVDIVLRNNNPYYRELGEYVQDYLKAQRSPLKYLYKDLKRSILEPLSSDTLFEITTFFEIIKTMEKNAWEETKIGLIGGKEKIISVWEKGTWKAEIYCQKMSKDLKENSIYWDIMEGYGLSDRARRPDIIVELSNGSNRHYLIIEVKRSKDRQYLADGAYKLLGYMKDFEGVINEKTKLSGILVGWDKIKEIPYVKDKINITTKVYFGTILEAFLLEITDRDHK